MIRARSTWLAFRNVGRLYFFYFGAPATNLFFRTARTKNTRPVVLWNCHQRRAANHINLLPIHTHEAFRRGTPAAFHPHRTVFCAYCRPLCLVSYTASSQLTTTSALFFLPDFPINFQTWTIFQLGMALFLHSQIFTAILHKSISTDDFRQLQSLPSDFPANSTRKTHEQCANQGKIRLIKLDSIPQHTFPIFLQIFALFTPKNTSIHSITPQLHISGPKLP